MQASEQEGHKVLKGVSRNRALAAFFERRRARNRIAAALVVLGLAIAWAGSSASARMAPRQLLTPAGTRAGAINRAPSGGPPADNSGRQAVAPRSEPADNRTNASLAATDPADAAPEADFTPSNVRTQDGKLIPVDEFFPSSRCAGCHTDTHAMWSASLHRNAAREPFYRESVDILLRTRGIEPTRHCESCHTPVALLSGALKSNAPRQQAPFTSLDDEGVTCTICHSIVAARLDGTGSYTIRRPALLAKEDGTPIFGNFTDEQILADIPAHKRAVMRPLLRTPEFCSVCHKVTAPASLNQYKNIKGFSAYDEWQQSGASRESVIPFYPRASRAECRTCHMPRVESLNDRAAKNGMIASHRFLGANTVAPLFYGQDSQVAEIEKFLESGVMSVDIFGIQGGSARVAPLSNGEVNKIDLRPGQSVTVEVVVSNRTAAHTFPPEVRDIYEAWVQFQAVDSAGRTVFNSGFIKPDGLLEESAHVYKQLLLDKQSRPITRHQIWLTNIKAYDNYVAPGRSDIARFRFEMPGEPGPVTLKATINYRRVNHEFSEYVLRQRHRAMGVPVVRMAADQVTIEGGADVAQTVSLRPPGRNLPMSSGAEGPAAGDPRYAATTPKSAATEKQTESSLHTSMRWNDYGIGLLEEKQYGPASDSFRRAAALDPADASLFVNAAIAEMATERFGPEHTQFKKAEALLERALEIDPANQRARYYRALVWRGLGRLAEAAEELKAMALAYPRDREVQRQLGQTLYSLGRYDEARTALEAVLAIDPTDAAAYQLLSPLYAMQGRGEDARRAQALYLQWRDDPVADVVAERFFAAHPQWTDERVTSHVHSAQSPPRPVLTGQSAAPAK